MLTAHPGWLIPLQTTRLLWLSGEGSHHPRVSLALFPGLPFTLNNPDTPLSVVICVWILWPSGIHNNNSYSFQGRSTTSQSDPAVNAAAREGWGAERGYPLSRAYTA